MNVTLNETHDPQRRSWVESANRPDADFPLQNLPFGVFRARGTDVPHIGVAIGDQVLDLTECVKVRLLGGIDPALHDACHEPTLNRLMSLGRERWSALRRSLFQLLAAGVDPRAREHAEAILVPMGAATMLLPAAIGDYTDFYASVHHATNVGRLFRPDNPLLPNYKYVPIGYHGRASSIMAGGTGVRRPLGQTRRNPEQPPEFGPSRQLDYELEMGFFVGPGQPLGEPIPLAQAPDHLFGACLLNDWSARDIQAWEYQPLGPFLAKNFATSASPWVVTLEALAPYRTEGAPRPAGDPEPLPYLNAPEDRARGGFDVELEVLLASKRMRDEGIAPVRLSRGNLRDLYWTAAQMLAHHTSGGCNMQPGDLLGTGTVSGTEPGSQGCLLELTRRGAEPIKLPTGETRQFLADGDEVILRGHCAKPGAARIGFGECRGTVLPARDAAA